MARSGAAVYATVDVSGRSSTEVARLVAAAMADDADYQVAQIGPDRFQIVRTYRPTWALVAAGFGLLAFGLGILFFFVRRTESCTLVIVDGPRGAAVTVAGRLLPGRMERLRDAAQNGASTASTPVAVPGSAPAAVLAVTPVVYVSPPPSAEPVTASPALVRRPVRREPLVAAPVGDAAAADETIMSRNRLVQTSAGSLSVRLDDGRVFTLDRRVLVGRDPAPHSDDAPAEVHLVPVSDPDRQVSKTHLAIGVAAGEAWVEDLYSTNGTTVDQPGGTTVLVAPGATVPLSSGSVVRFGGLRAEVVALG